MASSLRTMVLRRARWRSLRASTCGPSPLRQTCVNLFPALSCSIPSRPDGITIEDSGAAPRPVEVSMGINMESRLSLTDVQRVAGRQERIEELESQVSFRHCF